MNDISKLTVICCNQPMRNAGPWPVMNTDLVKVLFHCQVCSNHGQLLDMSKRMMWEGGHAIMVEAA